MKSVAEYFIEFRQIMGMTSNENEITLHYPDDTPEEARLSIKEIKLKQKELRLLRKDVVTTTKEISVSFSTAKSTVQAGFWSSVAGRRSAARERANKRETLRIQQNAQLKGYENVKSTIDTTLITLDKTIVEIERKHVPS